jgi:hypothetical protein
LTEVTDLNLPVIGDEDVEWLKVSMDDTFRMHIEDTLHDLVGEVLNVASIQLLGVVSNDIHQILRAILHHKVE